MPDTIQKDLRGPQYYVVNLFLGKDEAERSKDLTPDLVEFVDGKIRCYEGKLDKGGVLTFKDKAWKKREFSFSNAEDMAAFYKLLNIPNTVKKPAPAFMESPTTKFPVLCVSLPEKEARRIYSEERKDFNYDGLTDDYVIRTDPALVNEGLANVVTAYAALISAYAERPKQISYRSNQFATLLEKNESE